MSFRAIFKGNPCWDLIKVLASPLKGERIWKSLHRITGIPYFLRASILPFEEYLAVDAQRLANCKGLFAYEDAQDEKVKFIPLCTWFLYRKEVLRSISPEYGVAAKQTTSNASPIPNQI